MPSHYISLGRGAQIKSDEDVFKSILERRAAEEQIRQLELQNRLKQFQLGMLQPRINTGPEIIGPGQGLPSEIFQEDGVFRNRPRFQPTGQATPPNVIMTGRLPQAEVSAPNVGTTAPRLGTGPATTEQFTPPLERFGAQLGGFVQGVASPVQTMKEAVSGFIPEEVKRGFRQVRRGFAGPQPQIDTAPSQSPFFAAGAPVETPQEQRTINTNPVDVSGLLRQLRSDPFLIDNPQAYASAIGDVLQMVTANLDRQQKYDQASLDFIARQLATEASVNNNLLDALSTLASSSVFAGQTQEGLLRGAPVTRNPLMQNIIQRTMELLNPVRQTNSQDPLGIR